MLTGIDAEGYDITFSYSSAKNGSLSGFIPSLTYTPDSNFFGSDSFKFVSNDGFMNSDSATVFITVKSVNDKPILILADLDTVRLTQKKSDANIFPANLTAGGVTVATTIKDIDDDYISKSLVRITPYFTNEDTLLYSDSNISKINFSQTDSTATYEFLSPILLQDYPLFLSKIKYSNNAGYELTKGKRTIAIQIADDEDLSEVTHKIIELDIFNSPPSAISFTDTLLEDNKINFSLQGDDIDPDPLSFSITKKFTKGLITGTLPNLTYTPDENYFGYDELQFILSDGKLTSDTATINFVILPVNDPPTNFSLKNPADSNKVVITTSNVDFDVINFDWHPSQDVDNKELSYLFSGEFKMTDIQGKDIIHTIDTLTNATSFSITNRNILGILDSYLSPRGSIQWKVDVTDGQDTIQNNEIRTLIIEGQYVALSLDGASTAPKNFMLHENYPNPFNPTTQIRFDVPRVSNVTLTIYNMLGQKVRTFTMHSVPAGYHALNWKATNDFGVPVSAGLYLYQLQTEGFIQTKKMILLK